MHTWRKKALAALVLAFGMATTIATSAPHYERRESVTVSSDGRASSIVVFVDAETAQSARVGFDVEITSPEDMGELRIFHDDPEAEPDTLNVEPWGTDYRARNQRTTAPFTCHEGAEHCAYVFTIEPTNPVAYDISGFVILESGVELAEDAVFIVTTSEE